MARANALAAAGGICITAVVVGQAQPLAPLPADSVPEIGTFYLLYQCQQMDGCPPWPCNPRLQKPVYFLGGNDIFLVDDRPWPQLDTELIAAAEILRLTCGLIGPGGESDGLLMLDGEIPPPPDPGEGTNINNGFEPMTFGPDDLHLNASMSNSLLWIVIYSPTNGPWDILGTTNLTSEVSGLNWTNWVWVLRTGAAETNIALTNLWAEAGFFLLGTMLDEDSDGLSEAVERLVSHSDPNHGDVDGDGLGDLQEYLQGSNPYDPDSDADGFKDGPFALTITQPAEHSCIP